MARSRALGVARPPGVLRPRRIGALDAFLLALDHTAAYDSPNYLWFRERYPRFVYIDRVVVAPAARGCDPLGGVTWHLWPITAQ